VKDYLVILIQKLFFELKIVNIINYHSFPIVDDIQVSLNIFLTFQAVQ